jgi:LPS-assembly protein
MILNLPLQKWTKKTLLASLVLILLWGALGRAEGPSGDKLSMPSWRPGAGPVHIQADEVTYNYRTQIIILKGTVIMVQEDARLEADEVFLDTRDNSGEARGHARFYHGKDRLKGDSIQFQLDSKEGVVINGQLFLEKEHFYIIGSRIEKIGESTYLIDKGSFTTCDNIPPDWSFRGRKIDLTIGGYATAEEVTFRVREYPIFYIPYLVYPVRTERQTGFLIPIPGHSSRDGFMLDIPFYWAISRSADATFTPRVLSRRGPGLDTEFRTVLSPISRGEIAVDYLHDQLKEGKEDFGLFRRTLENRWRIKGWADLDKGEPLSAFLHLNLVGDRDFLQEFGTGKERYLPYLESTGEIDWRLDRTVISPQFRYFQDMTAADDRFTFQGLPEVQIQTISSPMRGPLYGSFLGAFRNSWREEGSRGLSGEAEPAIFVPLQWKNYLTVVPEVAIREVVEYVEKDPADSNEAFHQGLAKVSLKMGTQLERIFELGLGGLEKLRHSIEPSVTYLWTHHINGEEQRRLPFYYLPLGFAGEAPDLFLDLPEEQHALWFGLTSGLDGRGKSGAARLATVRILQGYGLKDFEGEEESQGRRWSDLYGEMLINAAPFLDLGGNVRYNHHSDEIVASNARLGLRDSRNDWLNMEWRHQLAIGKEQEINTINVDARVGLMKGLSFLYGGAYDRVERLVVRNELSLEYQPQCWLARLTLSDDAGQAGQKRDRRIVFFLSLYGLGPVVRLGGGLQ